MLRFLALPTDANISVLFSKEKFDSNLAQKITSVEDWIKIKELGLYFSFFAASFLIIYAVNI